MLMWVWFYLSLYVLRVSMPIQELVKANLKQRKFT